MKNNIVIRNFKKKDIKGIYELWEKTGLGDSLRGDNQELII